MPHNRLMYYGALIIGASGLLWLGAWLTKHIEWILPYTASAGGVLIVLGIALEVRNHRLAHATPPLSNSGETPRQSLP